MSRDDAAERGRAEPIDVEFEPADRDDRRGGGVSSGTALLLAIVAAGAGAAGGAVAPRVPAVAAALDGAFPASQGAAAPAPTAETEALQQRIAALEALINAPLAEGAADGADGAATAARVFAMQANLREMETRLSRMPSTDEVAALVVEVRRLQEELPAVAEQARTAAQASRAAFAVAAMTEATANNGPFEQSFASLQALLPNDQNVAALAPLARTGAPTMNELRERFDRLDNEIIRAAHRAQAGAGFWGRIQAALAQWIVVRRQGEGDTPAGVVERARLALNNDNLAGAVEELSRLNGAPLAVATPWVNDARRRLEINQRLAAIRTELSRRT